MQITNEYYKKLNKDIVQAMKDKEKQKLATLRLIVTDLKNEQIKLNSPELTEEQEEVVLNRYIKKLDNEMQSYVDVGRSTEKQETEKKLILSYLPAKLTEEEIITSVEEVIVEVGATTMKDMGKVMAAVKQKFGNAADMGLVNKTVKAKLS